MNFTLMGYSFSWDDTFVKLVWSLGFKTLTIKVQTSTVCFQWIERKLIHGGQRSSQTEVMFSRYWYYWTVLLIPVFLLIQLYTCTNICTALPSILVALLYLSQIVLHDQQRGLKQEMSLNTLCSLLYLLGICHTSYCTHPMNPPSNRNHSNAMLEETRGHPLFKATCTMYIRPV